jgi:hypothetical protein
VEAKSWGVGHTSCQRWYECGSWPVYLDVGVTKSVHVSPILVSHMEVTLP